MILLLEDNAHRIAGFRAAVARLSPQPEIILWTSAHAMIREAAAHLPAASLVCLDHDLIAAAGEPDPGDGLDVAKFLTSQPIVRPVIIHSSNGYCARMMQGEFDLAGWHCTRVLPFGDDWITADWLAEVGRVIGPR